MLNINTNLDPFFMTELELSNWLEEQTRKENEIHGLLSHLKFIPSIWKSETNTFIISKSAKKENMLQLTCFNSENVPCYDLIRSLNNLSDIVTELIQSDATIQQINYIN